MLMRARDLRVAMTLNQDQLCKLIELFPKLSFDFSRAAHCPLSITVLFVLLRRIVVDSGRLNGRDTECPDVIPILTNAIKPGGIHEYKYSSNLVSPGVSPVYDAIDVSTRLFPPPSGWGIWCTTLICIHVA